MGNRLLTALGTALLVIGGLAALLAARAAFDIPFEAEDVFRLGRQTNFFIGAAAILIFSGLASIFLGTRR